MTLNSLRGMLLAVIFTALLGGCVSTSVVSEWRDPADRPAPFKKVVVYVVADDDASRRVLEDRVAASFPKATLGVPSYTVFPDPKEINEKNREMISARLERQGFDGALTARLLSVDKQQVYLAPQSLLAPQAIGPDGSFYAYAAYANTSGYPLSGYTYQHSKYLIETILYEIPGGKMLWTMTTSSVNPDSRQQLVKEVTRLIDSELQKQGFIGG